ncbi:MAG: hypothetical protein IJQ68_05475 [Methanobrevibacter sp.]|uniref:hypothetical protein n=1 Tax=Methanobrevibacter sp. TaxID=66852 RepID=UPI0025D11846|nr:hypothetical protein [Methanobrevibacter sp.]MBR0271427.1 hypothetical protein [Methanobrevibacter sp.]
MTSEILILTPSAIALATDSAVTVGGRKTYNGVNKLFMLSNDPPMGIMTYNLANFSHMPLETIIKEFRHEITNDFKTVSDFKYGFEEFLKKLLDNPEHTLSFHQILSKFVNEIKKELENVSTSTFENIVNNMAMNFDHGGLNDYYNDILKNVNQNENELINLIPEYMDENKKNEFLENLKKFFIANAFIEPYTGIVITGFDDDRLFPSLVEFNITYLYDKKFILKTIEKEDTDGKIVDKINIKGSQVYVQPLAQSDVINTFLVSIDDYAENEIVNYFEKIHDDYLNNLENAIKTNPNLKDKQDEVLKEISKIYMGNKLLSDNFKNFINTLKFNHSLPILESIAALPKEELSNLAESLINITSLKRKVQTDLESVGGPVDVAIITKGDGFIWTKRKHYFDGELNPQFFKRNK